VIVRGQVNPLSPQPCSVEQTSAELVLDQCGSVAFGGVCGRVKLGASVKRLSDCLRWFLLVVCECRVNGCWRAELVPLGEFVEYRIRTPRAGRVIAGCVLAGVMRSL